MRSSLGIEAVDPPVVDEAKAPRATAPVRIAVVTGHASAHQLIDTVDGNLELFTRLCRTACREKLDLLVLPEICVHWGVPGSPLELGTTVPGPETQPFQALAAEQKVRVCLPLYERDGDAVYNTAVLIGPDGQIDGRYRKVHLASEGEEYSGLLPGDGFPVFDTEIGRVGCNICMDSSAVESSRMVGLNGADFLLLPIMGDHRADRFTMGPPRYNESRWQAIMRTRAMDNQFCLVAARNGGEGSCIVDNRGEILAWNEGNRDFIAAQVPPPDHRLWTGGRFREVNWMQRRPQLYGPFVDPA